jgi:hypothetical protein
MWLIEITEIKKLKNLREKELSRNGHDTGLLENHFIELLL